MKNKKWFGILAMVFVVFVFGMFCLAKNVDYIFYDVINKNFEVRNG